MAELSGMTWAELGERQAELADQLTEVRSELRRRAPGEAERRGPGHYSQMAREAGVGRQTLLEWLGKRTRKAAKES